MRKLLRAMPSERQVRSEVRRVSRSLGVREPRVEFHRTDGYSEYRPEEECVYLCHPEWAEEHKTPAVNYWILVYHEMAHHIAYLHGWSGHCVEMYAILTALILENDIPLDAFFIDEKAYRPRSFAGGRTFAGKALSRLLTAGGGTDPAARSRRAD